MEKFFAREQSKMVNYSSRKAQLEAVRTKIEKRRSIRDVEVVELKETANKGFENAEFSAPELAAMDSDYTDLMAAFSSSRK